MSDNDLFNKGLTRLRALGVDLMQGYLFRRPMAAADFGEHGPIIGLEGQSSGGSSRRSAGTGVGGNDSLSIAPLGVSPLSAASSSAE